MTKLIKTTVAALVVASALVAFRGPGPRQPLPPGPNDQQQPGNKRQQPRDADTLGREVDLDSARECIRLFQALAAKSRLTPEEQKRYPRFRRSGVNTTGEVFSGRKLLDWLQTTNELYESRKLTMHINVELGIYTEEYLRTYHPDDKMLMRKMLGRVGVFMIPVDSVTKWSIEKDDKLRPAGDGKAYSKAGKDHNPSPFGAGGIGGFIPENGATGAYFGGGGKGYDLGGIQP